MVLLQSPYAQSDQSGSQAETEVGGDVGEAGRPVADRDQRQRFVREGGERRKGAEHADRPERPHGRIGSGILEQARHEEA